MIEKVIFSFIGKGETMPSGVLNPKKTIVLMVDAQTKLLDVMEDPETLVKRMERVIEGAGWMEVPIIYSEHVPSKLGPTHPELSQFLKKSPKVEKVTFSLFGDDKFKAFAEKLSGKSVVMLGLEAHICILQTALELLNKIKCRVYVVADATASRDHQDYKLGLERLRDHGAEIVTSEMVLYEWLRTSEHKDFKIIQGLMK